MRKTLLLLCLVLWFTVACQDKTPVSPVGTLPAEQDSSSTPHPVPTAKFEIDDVHAQQLQIGRLLLINHMTAVENTNVPAAETWQLDAVAENESAPTYIFTSNEWTMALTSVESDEDVVFRARITGPNGFDYHADIRADSSVAPAQ